jgi:B12-binding domain/radical SAM domain protein
MLKDPKFDVERFIASLHSPLLFGIDLHWLPHAQGSLEIAKIVKKYHPETPVIFGGISSSYFYSELIEYPMVDMVMRGDSTEEPMRLLLEALKNKGSLSGIPNLVYKDKSGAVVVNPFTFVPSNLNHISLDYSFTMRSVMRYRDLIGHLPFVNWWEYPIVAALSCRGCTRNCATCGGSSFFFRNFMNRREPAFREPEDLANDIKKIAGYMRSPIFVLGDLFQAGEDYVLRFLSEASKFRIKNQVAFEFFTPPPDWFYGRLKEVFPHWSMEISLESADENVRRRFGKGVFSNDQLRDSLKAALANNCERLDLYFMTGIPFQTRDSVLNTLPYCEELYRELKADSRLLVFISPMAPFLDPGSLAFENPEKYGYRLKTKSIAGHRRLLTQPSWKYIMNYESAFLNPDDLVDSTYEVALGLNSLKAKYGAVSEVTAKQVEKRVKKAREVMKRIDEIMEKFSPEEREKQFAFLKEDMDKYSMSTVCEKRELEWKSPLQRFKILKIAAMLISRHW